MPYKVSGNVVLVLRNDQWVALKRHETHAEALAHLAALNIHVMADEKRRKPKQK